MPFGDVHFLVLFYALVMTPLVGDVPKWLSYQFIPSLAGSVEYGLFTRWVETKELFFAVGGIGIASLRLACVLLDPI